MWPHTVERRLWPSFSRSDWESRQMRQVTTDEVLEGAVEGNESPEVDVADVEGIEAEVEGIDAPEVDGREAPEVDVKPKRRPRLDHPGSLNRAELDLVRGESVRSTVVSRTLP